MKTMWSIENDVNSNSCGCVGPQEGQPLCPCMMRQRGIVQKNGRWIQPEQDLGPAVSILGDKDR